MTIPNWLGAKMLNAYLLHANPKRNESINRFRNRNKSIFIEKLTFHYFHNNHSAEQVNFRSSRSQEAYFSGHFAGAD